MKIIAAAAFLLALAAPAMAQKLEPAPVPNRIGGEVAPAERVGRPDGSERSAPFSGLPNTIGVGSGQDTPQTQGQTTTSTSPAPSLSR